MSGAAPVADARPVLLIQPDRSDPPGRVGDWLTAAGLELDLRDLDRGDEVPTELTGYRALVVLGGAASVTDPVQLAALRPVLAVLRSAVQHEVPTLAICLGAQLLAAAHGGKVERGVGEFGAQLVAKRSAASTDPLFRDVPITPDVLQWHFDEITRLPAGAVLLATSPSCEVQAFRLGRLTWGLQFHIEATPEVVQTWAVADRGQLADHDLDAVLERVRLTDADVVEAWQPVVESFATIVRDPQSVSAARSVPASSAAPITDPAAIRAALAAEMAASRSPLPTPVHRTPSPELSADPSADSSAGVPRGER